jgi:hypothetical protein
MRMWKVNCVHKEGRRNLYSSKSIMTSRQGFGGGDPWGHIIYSVVYV